MTYNLSPGRIAVSRRILAVKGDMFSCLSDDCPRFLDCWRAQKPHHNLRQCYATPEPKGCSEFIAIERGEYRQHSPAKDD